MSSKPNVMIVDDKLANLIALERVLSDLDINIVRATSGNEALGKTLNHELALILLDVQMPDMDGYETLELLRSNESTFTTPVIFISAVYKSDEHQIKGIETGAIDFIPKPIIPEVVIGKVSLFCKLYTQRINLEIEIENRNKIQTQKDKMQKDIIERSKQTALETLAAGIAHEVNNPLAIITGTLDLLSLEDVIANNNNISKSFDDIKEAGSRIGEIVKSLRSYSEGLNEEETDFSVDQVINNLLNILGSTFRDSNTPIICNLKSDTARVLGKKNCLQRVLIEILTNSKDALGKKEEDIHITTKNVDDSIVIQIQDKGVGFTQEEKAQAFDLFYTTKDPNKGTGLGLSISYSLVQELNGSLKIESQKNNGTTVTIKLPIFQEN